MAQEAVALTTVIKSGRMMAQALHVHLVTVLRLAPNLFSLTETSEIIMAQHVMKNVLAKNLLATAHHATHQAK